MKNLQIVTMFLVEHSDKTHQEALCKTALCSTWNIVQIADPICRMTFAFTKMSC